MSPNAATGSDIGSAIYAPGELYRLAVRESNYPSWPVRTRRCLDGAVECAEHAVQRPAHGASCNQLPREYRPMRYLACLITILLLGACSQESMLQKFSSPQDQATAKGYIDGLRAHDFGAIESAMDPSIRTPNLHGTLETMANLIPAQEPTSIKVVGAQTSYVVGTTTVNTTFEYNFGGKWLLANVAIQEKNGAKTIVGFNIYPRSQSLESENHFSLSGKGTAQYLILAMTIFAVLLTLYSLVICIRTKLPGRKWPWILFILCGFGKVAVNWSTGEWDVYPLSFQLLSAGAFAQFYGPWIVSASIPLGAIFFLRHRRKLLASGAGSTQSVAKT